MKYTSTVNITNKIISNPFILCEYTISVTAIYRCNNDDVKAALITTEICIRTTLRVETYLRVVRDLLDSMAASGFRRIVLVNGHGGNIPAQGLVGEWLADHPGKRVRFHNWWNAPRTWAKVQEIDPVASHASWMENFPWTRLADIAQPDEQKPMTDLDRLRQLSPAEARAQLGDGNFGGRYQRPDADMQAIWDVAVAETRAVIDGAWPGDAMRGSL